MLALAVLVLAVGTYAMVVRPLQLKHRDDRLTIGKAIYAQHCAVCHGLNLEGQPNWQTRNAAGRLPAPPHDDCGHTWHHSDEQLFRIIKFGMSAEVPNYENDMLGFADKITDQEILAIIAFIKTSWSPQSRDYQEERNRSK